MRDSGEDILKPHFSKPEELFSLANQAEMTLRPDIVMIKPGIQRKITLAEIQAHDKAEPWFVVNGEVYDGTGFLGEHPGGAESILISAGEDATEDFMAIHSPEAKLKLAKVTLASSSDSESGQRRLHGHSSTLAQSMVICL
jgi:nitrate reductase (NAD(P)H)